MGVGKCVINDEKYPSKLLALSSCPKILYYMGNVELLKQNIIAVIGKRDAEEKYLTLAAEIGSALAEKGFIVLNGLAIGCDTKAIEGALSRNGKVIAVMPCGLDEIYPKSNRLLAERILKMGGCIISEYPCGTKPQKYSFVERDRLQAGLADKVIVVDSEIKGGTMHTVNYALNFNRDIGCIIEENDVSPEGNEYLYRLRKCEALKNVQSVLAFVDTPVFKQMTLF